MLRAESSRVHGNRQAPDDPLCDNKRRYADPWKDQEKDDGNRTRYRGIVERDRDSDSYCASDDDPQERAPAARARRGPRHAYRKADICEQQCSSPRGDVGRKRQSVLRRPGMAELSRLEHLRDLLTASGHDATQAVLGLFSATGFTDDLTTEAARSKDRVLLAGLDRLYATGT